MVLGLISDTLAPELLAKLPEAAYEALAGVDLILHAGDVGELWVLDRPDEPFAPPVDLSAALSSALAHHETSLLAPDLRPYLGELARLVYEHPAPLKVTYMRLAHWCWRDRTSLITKAELMAEIDGNEELPEGIKAQLRPAWIDKGQSGKREALCLTP